MNLTSILAHIKNMKDREGLVKIINAAESRSLLLSNLDRERRRKQLWTKVRALGLVKGDMVFVHAQPETRKKIVRENYTKPNGQLGWKKVERTSGLSGQHFILWGKPLTVMDIKTRNKEIVVRVPGSTIDHILSPFTCVSLKLSKEPSTEAFAKGLQE